uniref:G_PROTEIN_RECEP_F1_2 domain-containing protein n=1 Tax=Caenorhabditis tropicalis TaxID=1561998 RepID=A0A1I7UL85_9PELO
MDNSTTSPIDSTSSSPPPLDFYNSLPPANYSLSDLTVTPMSYRDRITVEFILNATSWLLSTFLVIFVRLKKAIWMSLKSTIVFVTVGSFLLNIPLLLFQAWMVINLQSGHQPVYSVFICSFLKNFCSSTTSAYQVLPFAVSLYRYRTVVLKGHPSPSFVINIHSVVTLIFIIYAFLNYPFGQNNKNDVCFTLRFSNGMELVRIFSTLLFNFVAIIVNCVILRFVKHFENVQSKRVQLTQSLLIQSVIPVLVSLPLLLLSFEFYFGIPMPSSFGSTWYALTFLGPFLMPLSSILGIKSTRRELFDTFLCGCFPKPSIGNSQMKSAVTVIMASKMERSTFTVRDDD